MKKIITILAALAMTLGLAAIPAQAVETVSNASLYNSSLSQRIVYIKTASSGGTSWGVNPGKYHTVTANGTQILSIYTSAGCRMEITTGGLTLSLAGGQWHTWTPSNNVQTSGTETVRVRC